MRSDDGVVADAIIVGGGYSGTMAAAQLVRRGISTALVEGAGRAGRGTAYSTPEDVHLLNVPAAKMSAWADQPDHFAQAVAGDGFGPGDFVPRRRFGTYLTDQLEEAKAAGLRVVEATAESALRVEGGWAVTLNDGSVLTAKALLLANGNQPPERLRVAEGLSGKAFVNDPWSDEGRAAIRDAVASGGDVLVLGTGLTMVDVVLSLSDAGHGGRIVALSRRGQLPRGHASHDAAPVEADEVPHGSVLGLWRWLRRRASAVGWRGAVDSLRPHSQRLWQSFSPAEQRRFLRHARPWWDVHRHRIAPQIAARLKELIGEGRLEIVAGRVTEMGETGEGVEVSIARRGRALSPAPSREREYFALVINCTGPLGSMARSRDPLLRQMLDEGAVEIDALGMGLTVDGDSRAGDRVWALGPLAKGQFWEIVAVPDIRTQVAAVADDIAKELHR
ncbi:FAD/NAD(P)-binding protein [Sphingomonas sp. LY160]|uniref:FAD/NAD(P)-binding protein n=1 Tax=Sphingomonas sp. LY160 TaxID=3095342 RepID=UPI002ADEAAA2|nr:FAD/NAD(P)-binding protein [Sphingomonas sp. LY160]MEA1073273.1 FAD/NAD(P)-binding protein [Sphingomonas sp. LY160]